jgi:hypothetical protein
VRQTESPVIATARDEIQRLRESAEQQVAQSQGLINRLRSQLAQIDKADEVDADIDEQMLRIKTAEAELDTLVEEKYTLEGEYRKLEAEVGPIKYIAEFIYGEQADKNLLEKAVTWVIVIIIFVFDPLAVLLLIASQYTFEWRKTRKDDDGDRLRRYEQSRAQRIVDNVPPNFNAPTPPEEKEEVNERVDQPTDSNIQDDDVELDERDREADDEADIPERSAVEEDQGQIPNSPQEQVAAGVESKKKLESSDELNRLTEEQLDALDQEPEWKDAKQRWKDDHPNDTIKNYKTMYLKGIISKLPWETYLTEPVTDDEQRESRYIQNAEQSQQSIWSRMPKDNE